MDSELLTCLFKILLSISQTTFRHCRVRFYAFFGQPLSKQLYCKWHKHRLGKRQMALLNTICIDFQELLPWDSVAQL